VQYIFSVSIVVLILLIIGIFYQNIATIIDRGKYPASGKFIDLGGYKLYLNCIGEGSPTVILDCGLVGLSSLWTLIQEDLAKFTKVCIYDRAGYGRSDRSPYPRTSERIVDELHLLLQKAEILPPYILVGHSMGGLNTLLFASHYPEEVAGIVLVDAVPPNVYSRMPQFGESMQKTNRLFLILSIISKFGLLRLSNLLFGSKTAPDFVQNLPSDIQSIVLPQFTSKTFSTAMAENRLMPISADRVKNISLKDNLPLIILSRDRTMFTNSDSEKSQELIWKQLQAEMTKFSLASRFRIVDRTSHYLYIDRPDSVVQAIKEMIENL
jgi:pimeloyl-ACP methyl ester carboxylesterase